MHAWKNAKCDPADVLSLKASTLSASNMKQHVCHLASWHEIHAGGCSKKEGRRASKVAPLLQGLLAEVCTTIPLFELQNSLSMVAPLDLFDSLWSDFFAAEVLAASPSWPNSDILCTAGRRNRTWTQKLNFIANWKRNLDNPLVTSPLLLFALQSSEIHPASYKQLQPIKWTWNHSKMRHEKGN